MSHVWKKIKHFATHSGILQKKIVVLPRILRGYLNTLVLSRDSLRTLELTVTPFCNVKCEMCYATKIIQKDNIILTPEEYTDIWQQAKKLGAFSVVISGGEPTVRKDLLDVIAAIEPDKTLIGIVSNSTNLNREKLQQLFNAGVSVVHLSLNSLDEDINDRERDFQGHFERVKSVIDEAKKVGFQILLSTVISHNELDRMRKIVRFAKERNIGVCFSLACPTGRWEGVTERLLSSSEWEEIDAFMKNNPHTRGDWTINYSLKQECPGGREKLCISPYGDVMGCGMNFISLGNVRNEPLKDIWERACSWAPFKKRPRQCLIALDEEYLHEYLLPIVGADVLPVPIDKHPKHPMPLPEIRK